MHFTQPKIVRIIGASVAMLFVISCSVNFPIARAATQTVTQTSQADFQAGTVPTELDVALGDASIPFIANEGQISAGAVKYYTNTLVGSFFVTDSALRYSMIQKGGEDKGGSLQKKASLSTRTEGGSADGAAFDEQFVDSSGKPIVYTPHGENKTDIPVSYYQGQNQSEWKKNVANYFTVSLGELWDGIDVILKAHGKNVEKIFTVQPGADSSDIAVSFSGVKQLSLQDDGTLRIATPAGDVSMTAPIAYQMNEDGLKKYIPVSYEIHSGMQYGFSVGTYDHAKPLIIDPLIAGTFLGTGREDLYSISIDTNGDVFVAGTTRKIDFPTTVGAFQQNFGGGSDDFFISKFDPSLTQLLASTYLGGSGYGYYGIQIKVDKNHDVYMVGSSTVAYPTTAGAYKTTCLGGSYCSVVSKFNNDLTDLLASTYVGDDSNAFGLDIDSNGKVFLTGASSNVAYPTTSGVYKEIYEAGVSNETTISRLDADLTTLEASTFVGNGEAYSIKIDLNDNVFIVGSVGSSTPQFPATAGAYDTNFNVNKFFISKLSNDLTQLTASTYLGTTTSWMTSANPNMMALDSAGNVYVTEQTPASDFPTTPDAYQTVNAGSTDSFISKLSNDLGTLLASTYLGGSDYDESDGAIAVDSGGHVFVTVYTSSTDYPTTAGAYKETSSTWSNVTVSKLSSQLDTLLASTYLVTSDEDDTYPYALAINPSGDVYVGGTTYTSDFPTTLGAYQNALVGSSNGGIVGMDNNLGGLLPSVIAPTLTTEAVSAITTTTATGSANISDTGGENPDRFISWGTAPGTYTDSCDAGTGSTGDYSCGLTNLVPGTIYYVRASATNSAGTTNGDEVSFTTVAAEGEDTPPDQSGTDPTPIITPTITSNDLNHLDISDNACKPKSLSAKIDKNGDVKLSWKKPCGLIDSIRIERKPDKGKFQQIASVKNNSNRSYIDDGEALSGKYIYRIRGYRKASGKYSDYSKEASVIVTRPATAGTVHTADTAPDTNVTADAPVVEPFVLDVNPDTATADPQTPEAFPIITPNNISPSLLSRVVAAIKQFATQFSTELATLALAGVAAGIAIASTSAAVPLFATTSAQPFSGGLFRFFGIMGIVGKRKKEYEDWGTVFDSETRQPIRAAVVTLINEGGNVAASTATDSQGRYGFLPTPGTYTIRIDRKDYRMDTAHGQDVLYGNTYAGQGITVTGSEVEKANIALTTTAVNWQDFAKRKVAASASILSVIKRDFFIVLFYLGFAVSTGIAFMFPSPLNSVIFVIYLLMIAYQLFFQKNAYGRVTQQKNGKPVPFAMVVLHKESEPEKRAAFAVSDVLGRYYLLAENGTYLAEFSGNLLGGERFKKLVRVRVQDGMLRSDVGV